MGDLAIFGAALVFGFGSAVFPVLNAEAYVLGLGTLVDENLTLLLAIVALSVGTVAGKAVVFVVIRRGSERFRKDPDERRPPRTRLTAWLRRVGDLMLTLLDRPVTGAATVFVSSLTAIPPLAVVSIVAALSRQRLWVFLVMVLLGRTLQYLALAFLIHHVTP
ncbi:VTT domain-containing protein [Aeromicrobium sp. CF4.19]|uniref:VTT domain-containing protein n=1 Tax=Aeromicrobium sp. CF4.19 TaxID=3373082 RepID=UPI003EE5322E